MDKYTYTGNELDVFAGAANWKKYFTSIFKSYLRGSVLEVGAGIGSKTPYLLNSNISSFTCLEPDRILVSRIEEKVKQHHLPELLGIICGTTSDIPADKQFDAILYIDVIEHIEDDKAELNRARNLLKQGGSLIILVPAFNSLYTEFDKEIGHYRRYVKKTLRPAIPEGFELKKLIYLDSAGFFASLANKLLFSNSKANPKVIKFWDQVLVRFSILADKILFHTFGKSLVGIWQKTA